MTLLLRPSVPKAPRPGHPPARAGRASIRFSRSGVIGSGSGGNRRAGRGWLLRSPGLVAPSAYYPPVLPRSAHTRGAAPRSHPRPARLLHPFLSFEAVGFDTGNRRADRSVLASMNRRRVGPGVSGEPQLACVQEQRSTGATRRWEERGPATVGAIPDPPAGCHRFRFLLRCRTIELRHAGQRAFHFGTVRVERVSFSFERIRR